MSVNMKYYWRVMKIVISRMMCKNFYVIVAISVNYLSIKSYWS